MQLACGHCGSVSSASSFVGAGGVACCPCCNTENPKVMTAAHMAGFWPFSSSSSTSDKPGVLETVGQTAETISTAFKLAMVVGGGLLVYMIYRTTKTFGEQSREVIKVLPVVVAPEAQVAGGLSERMARALAR
jgi:hypothetical protein